MTQLTTNPFAILLAGLSETEAQPVTLEFLSWVSATVNEPSVLVQTYGEAFKVLEFLAAARVVELLKIPDTEIHTIKRI